MGSRLGHGHPHVRRPVEEAISKLRLLSKTNELASMLVKKGFVVSTMEEKIMHDIVIHWNEFVKLLKIEKDELQKDSQIGSDHILTNFEGFSGPRLAKKQKMEKIEAKKKEKILTK